MKTGVPSDMDMPLHEGQVRAHNSLAQVIAVIAGTGGGKTAYEPVWILQEREKLKAKGHKAPHGIVVAPYKILRRTTMPTILNLLERKLKLGEWESKQDGIWRFYDGGYIYFCSADTPESIEGAHVHWAVLDEAGQRQFPEESFRAAERRVRFNEGRILITTTPYVLGWLKDLGDASLLPHDDPAARPDVEIITFPSIQNPRFPKREFERARATLPPWMFRMFYEGVWDRPAGLVYSMVEDKHWISMNDILEQYKVDEDHMNLWPRYAGMDFGYHAPQANVYAIRAPDDKLFIFDEYYETEKTNSQNAREAPYKNEVRMAWGDPAAPEAIAEFAMGGWHVTRAPKFSVLEGLRIVFELILQGNLFFVRGNLTKTSRELDTYMWSIKEADQVEKMNDHAMDALRYLCVGLRNAGLGRHIRSFDNPTSSGRMGRHKEPDPSIPEDVAKASSSPGVYLGTRANHKNRLQGLPKRR